MDPALAAYLAAYPDSECPACGYSLRGIEGEVCPECGGTLSFAAIRRHRIRAKYGRLTLPQVVGLLALGCLVPLGPLTAAALAGPRLGGAAAIGTLVAVIGALTASLAWRTRLSKQPPTVRWTYALGCLTPLVVVARVLLWR